MANIRASLGGIVTGALVLSVLSWIVALAGVAALQHDGLGGATLGFIWWGVWFQFFVLVLILAATFTSYKSLANTNYTFLGMVTVVLMVTADQSRNLVSALSGSRRQAAQASLAGTILLIIFNIVLILAIAADPEDAAVSNTSHRAPQQSKAATSPSMTSNPVATV
ncbi:hypothetical protein ACKKBG_A06600 [Auxenochlorella protothecoides x Auxenochlorella symbiontica]